MKTNVEVHMEYYMFHKPSGCITARKDKKHATVMDYFSDLSNDKLNPVGRLDKDTEGLLIITDDGDLNQQLTNPEHHVEKTYFFYALGNITEEKVKSLKEGVLLKGSKSPSKCLRFSIGKQTKLESIRELLMGTNYEKVGKNPRNNLVTSGTITIAEGKKHQVKRMLRAVDCYIIYLKRESIGKLNLDENLGKGKYRALTTAELSLLRKK